MPLDVHTYVMCNISVCAIISSIIVKIKHGNLLKMRLVFDDI